MQLYRDPANKTTRVLAVLAPALASLLLAACGGSSKTTSATAPASSASKGPAIARLATLRECMKRQGITLPTPTTRKPKGAGPPSGGAFPLGGAQAGSPLPKGVTQTQFQAALRKCGGNASRGRGGGKGRIGRLSSPAFRKALARFAACLHQNGVAVPAPNTSGNGPIFSTKGLDINSPRFKAAQKKCRSLLRVSPGATGAPPSAPSAGGAPPSPAG